jgi:hypothetical protein
MILVRQILTPKQKGFAFWLSMVGLMIGAVASLLAIMLMWDIKVDAKNQADVFGDNTIVIQKHVSSLTSLGLNGTGFNQEDVIALRQQSFIVEVAPFKTANYEVGISENPGDGLPGFYAEMFLQAVPNSFLEGVDSTKWHWETETDIVPIILPRNFLTLVNYGIAPSKGIPQVSEDLIKSVRVRLHLIGKRSKGTVLGQVVGFSTKISSVLVPESFIDFSNQKYGASNDKLPSRLFIRTKPKSFAKINQLVEEMNLDIAENDLNMAKVTTYILQLIFMFFIFSFIIVALALAGLLQYIQMKLLRFQYEVRLLIQLGHPLKSILSILQWQFFKRLLLIMLIAVVIVFLCKFFIIQPVLISVGFESSYWGLLIGTLFVALILFSCVFVLKKSAEATILKIYKKD